MRWVDDLPARAEARAHSTRRFFDESSMPAASNARSAAKSAPLAASEKTPSAFWSTSCASADAPALAFGRPRAPRRPCEALGPSSTDIISDRDERAARGDDGTAERASASARSARDSMELDIRSARRSFRLQGAKMRGSFEPAHTRGFGWLG